MTFDKMIDGTKTLGEPVFGNLGEGVIGICGEKFPSFSELEVLSIETEVTGFLSGLGVWVQVVPENCDGTVVGTGTGKSERGNETSNDGTGENSSDWGGKGTWLPWRCGIFEGGGLLVGFCCNSDSYAVGRTFLCEKSHLRPFTQ
jgi:hypothetical protein